MSSSFHILKTSQVKDLNLIFKTNKSLVWASNAKFACREDLTNSNIKQL